MRAPASTEQAPAVAAAVVVPERVPAGVAAITPIGTNGAATAPDSAAVPAPAGVTADLIRTRLAQLDQWTTPLVPADGTQDFHSCLSPIKVKLIRADGVVTERRGCRMQSTWSAQVSSLTSEFESYLAGAH